MAPAQRVCAPNLPAASPRTTAALLRESPAGRRTQSSRFERGRACAWFGRRFGRLGRRRMPSAGWEACDRNASTGYWSSAAATCSRSCAATLERL